ncbi:MAG: DNA cytosine methyltransferase [Candidatus Desantisbacteria bacterium]
MSKMIVIDLFAGAGGLGEGFTCAGFKVIAHVEKEKWACETLKTRTIYHFLKENKDLKMYYEYLRKLDSPSLIEECRKPIYHKYPELQTVLNYEIINAEFGNPDIEPKTKSSREIITLIEKSLQFHSANKVDVIIGGPPCQAYSLIGRNRMGDSVAEDRRNFLFRYYFDVVKYFQPDILIFENVPGIITARNGEIFQMIQKEFVDAGYNFYPGHNEKLHDNILNSKNFGVYQSRKRMILFGSKKELNIDYPEFPVGTDISEEDFTTFNAISDLPFLIPGEGHNQLPSNYPGVNNLSHFQRKMRDENIGVLNHMARSLTGYDREIYKKAINEAASGRQLKYSDLPESLKRHKNEKNFKDRFKVHWWSNIPHTIVAHIARDGHYNIHPDIRQLRSLTVREAARIQSFPDNYKFEGPRTAQYTQVGNAVPPLMAEKIAGNIKELLP